jgi:hypothetical protein
VSGARATTVALGLALAVAALTSSAPAGGAVIHSHRAQPASRTGAFTVAAGPPTSPQAHGRARAPDGPPLDETVSPSAAESTEGVASGDGDPLVDNGLSSPLCKGALGGSLSGAAQANCQTSAFAAAPAPTKDYELDVNIDVGPIGLSKGGLLAAIQDTVVVPTWNALEWLVHALVVMLEWCYTLNLLDGPTMSSVAQALRQAQDSFTQPWLALALAAASALTVYNGLVRRRVTETLGGALATTAMMAVGLWVIADPLGTVGVIGQWADEASLGTLSAVAGGAPSDSSRTLADSMGALFAGAIEAPWCYLEFGNVRWCEDPALLDSRLRAAGLRLEAGQRSGGGCGPPNAAQLCAPRARPGARAVERTDRLIRQARTNGALFLAFPANGPERNSVKEPGSLLHVLCQASNDTKCTGPTAAQAEFRSASGTFPRMIGLALIAAGVLGMAMLFGLVAVRLLGAALVGLFVLLLAPAAVLAPALGESGRSIFTAWLGRLVGAVGSKLLYSFLLGVLLTTQRLLTALHPLGWWTQWLLISTFWWTVFFKRHQAAAFLRSGGRRPATPERRPIAGRIENVRQAHRAVRGPASWTKRKILGEASAEEQLERPGPASGGRPSWARAPVAGGRAARADGPRADPSRARGEPAERAQTEAPSVGPSAPTGEDSGATPGAGAATVGVATATRGSGRPRDDAGRPARHSGHNGRFEPDFEGGRSRGSGVPGGEQSESTPTRDEHSGLAIARPLPRAADRAADSAPRAGGGAGLDNAAVESSSPVPRTFTSQGGADPRMARSRVMEDARAVAERRKRQLGFQRPSDVEQPPGDEQTRGHGSVEDPPR